jgi:hypothetical protein
VKHHSGSLYSSQQQARESTFISAAIMEGGNGEAWTCTQDENKDMV